MQLKCYPLPSVDEQVVNTKIIGDCGHRKTGVRNDMFRGWVSYCRECGAELEFGRHDDMRPTPEEQRKLWLSVQLRPGQGKLNSAIVECRLHQLGWGISFMTRNGQSVCTLEKLGRRLRSRAHPSKPAALIDAAAQLARIIDASS